jgi:TRAP-type mannitol/chloroaromatic compound transport system permease small subunit
MVNKGSMKYLPKICFKIISLSTIDKISEISAKAVSWLFIGASIITFYDVIMRYAFNRPTVWGLEFSLWLLIATYFISGGYATMLRSHIRLDALYVRWPEHKKAAIDVFITGPLLIIFSLIIIWQGGNWTWEAIITGERTYSLWAAPYWPVKITIPIGGFLVFLQGIAELIRDSRVLKRNIKK